MGADRLDLVKSLVDALPELTAGQLHWLEQVVSNLHEPHVFALSTSDLFDETTLANFGDAMRVHHSFSVEPFSKYLQVND